MRLSSGNRLRAASAAIALVIASGGAAAVGFVSPASAAQGTASCAANPPSSSHVGRFLGIVRPRLRPAAATRAMRQCSVTSAPSRGSEGGSNMASPYGGTPPLTYHGGPIMATPSVSDQLVLTPIFWGASGSFAGTYQSVIDQYITDVAHDSGQSTDVFAAATQYTDSLSNHVHYDIVAGTPITDTNTYPANGCTPDTGAIYSDSSGYTKCLTDAQLQTQVQTEITAHSFSTDYGHLYALFLPKGVENCFTSSDGAHGGTCTINTHSKTAGGFCAYHSSFGSGPAIYASMPFPVYQSPTGYTCGADAGPGVQTLNGNTDADTEVSPLSHETNESMTDPLGNAWYDSSGNEDGDDCAYIYGTLSGPSGAEYNQTINGHHYLTQEEFSNEDYVANTSGCVQGEELPTAAIGANPTSPAIGQSVTFSASGSADDDPNGGGIASYSWNFGDTSTTVTTTATTSHSYSKSGSYLATLQVTDIDGWTSSAASVTVNVATSLSVTSVSPSSVGAGATAFPVTITGSNFVSGATVGDSNGGVSFSSVVVQSATSISANVSVTPAAALGATNVTVNEPGPTSATCNSCLTVAAAPTATGITPSAVAAGTSQPAQISGSNFETGAVVSVSGTGVSTSGVTVTASSISLTLSVSAGAATNSRGVTVTNPDGGTVTCAACLVVDASPAVGTITPGTFVTGTTTPGATISGSGFQTGVLVGVSGTGVTAAVAGTVTSTSISVNVTVSSGASSGARNLTVTNPDGGTYTCAGCLTIDLAPSATGVTPGTVVTGTSGPASVIGSNFQTGALVVVSGTGVTASVNTVTGSSISVTVTVTSGATTGARNVTITNPDGGTSTCTGCLVVDAAPTASGIGPVDFVTGTAAPATLSGANFQPGALVAVSGTGVIANVGTVTSGSISLTVTVSSGAVTGPRNVTVTNPDGGTVTCTGCLVVDAAPTVSGLAPVDFVVGSVTPATLSGANFQAGALVAVSGTGVSASVGTVSSGSIPLSVTVTAGAATGPRNVTITNPDSGTVTCTGCLVVDAAPTASTVAPFDFVAGTVTPATLSGTNFQAGATVNVSGTGVTASVGTVAPGSITLSVTVSSGAAAVPHDVTIQNPDGGTATCSGCLTVVLPAITNGTFETGNLSGWTSTGTTSVTTSTPHAGKYAALLGSTAATNGDSSISQTFAVPSNDSALNFDYYVTCPDVVTNDWATATLTNVTAGTTATVLAKTCVAASGWKGVKVWVVPTDVYTLTITNHDDDNPANPTYTKVDDVKFTAAAFLANGDFELGALTKWTHSGTAGVTTSGPHSGTYAALLGATTATAASTIAQTFTVPITDSTLTFWYDVSCPDIVTHDWATATLEDVLTVKTVTILPKTCVASSGWVEVTTSVIPGHTYKLTLANRDDQNPANPTYTKYDDVAVS